MRKKIFIAITLLLLIGLSFKFYNDDDDFELIKNLEIYHNVMKQLRINYVEEVDSRNLISESINDMLQSLDPYTVYYSESQIETFRLQSQSKSVGTGITVDTIKSKFYVIDVTEKSSAAKEGVITGDIILEINGIDVNDRTLQDVNSMLAGQPGTDITIKFLRVNENYTLTLKREIIEEKVVSLSQNIDGIGYIKLESFTDKAAYDFKEAFMRLKDDGINSLIIDLRNNPGGLLDQAVKIVNLFIAKDKVVVTSKGNSVNANATFSTKDEPIDTEIPIVVLINNRSASASEIVAGALQDYDRAVIIGEQSFGKGLVQRFFDVGYNSQIKITIAKYYIPSGRCVQAINYSNISSNNTNAEFYTANGRVVFEGNGIAPDVFIDKDTLPEIINLLLKEKAFFRFANEYYSLLDTSSISIPNEISFSETSKFITFIEANNVFDNFKTINDLNKILLTYSNNTEIISNTKKIIDEISVQYINDLNNNSNIIGIFISKEIAKRKYFHSGVVEYSLKIDAEINEAKQILNDNYKYLELLSVN